jgi:peptidoglycan/LPS O-acetylase OafA/YrhL
MLIEEPIWKLIPGILNAATAAVCCFFAISGYLVTQSFISRANGVGRSSNARGIAAFIAARVLRIFPAFLVCLLCAILLGAFVTSVPFGDYWRNADTWRYFYANALLQNFNALPGVFTNNPNGSGVNGSIWTIPLEVGMYGATLLFGVLQAWRNRWRALLAVIAMIAWCLLWPSWFVFFPHEGHSTAYLVACYMLGTLWAVWRIDQRTTVLFATCAALIFVASFVAQANLDVARIFAVVAIALTALFVGRLRFPALGWATRFGDLSYGVFLYSSLIQQVLIWAYPRIMLAELLLASVALSAAAALLSWHLVEKRALRLKPGA